MKTLILSLVLALSVLTSVCAQDKIIKRNGTVISGKVTEVGIRDVRYQLNSDVNSAKFVIRKAELERIEFGNGETVLINDRSARKTSGTSEQPDNAIYGKNVIMISPFKALDSGPGLGVSYERIVGENGYVGIIVPLSLMFKERYYYNQSTGSGNKYYSNFYISPGVKLYPFGQRKVTYAVGPNLMLGFTKNINTQYIYDTSGGQPNIILTPVNHFRLGLIVNNYLNFQITSKVNLGINGGLGIRYLDRSKPNIGYNDGMQITGEFAFNFGFRF
jgi:hypothetical protein